MTNKAKLNFISRFLESKDRLIDRLNLTDEQKEELKAFFQAHPNFENKIDWNRKDLTYDDFSEVLSLEGNTKSSKKKYGLSGKAQIEDLIEGQDYLITLKTKAYTVYYPLNFKASEVLAKPTTPPLGITGKWCIAGKNYSPGTRDQHWNNYTAEGQGDFFFIFTARTKYALYRPNYDDPSRMSWTDMRLFNCRDQEMDVWNSTSQTLNSSLFKKLYEYPRKLEELWLEEKRGYCDKDGIAYSKDNKILISAKDYDATSSEYKIPEGVDTIHPGAFMNCLRLTAISCPETLDILGAEAFFHSSLETIAFPENCEIDRIPRETFGNNYYLKNLKYGKQDYTLPDSITEIGPYAFSYCMSLTSLKFPKGLRAIRVGAFQHSRLKEVDLSETNLTMLEPVAFADCEPLEIIRLPMSIFKGINRGIHPNTFMRCKSLKQVYFYGPLPKGQTIQAMEDTMRSIISQWLEVPPVEAHFIIQNP